MALLKAHPHCKVHPIPHDNIHSIMLAKHEVNNPSAQCLVNALDILISSYSDIVKNMSKLKQCPSEANFKLINGCLDGLIKSLDVCNNIRAIVCEVGHYDMLLHKAIRCLDGRDLCDNRAKAMLAKCMDAVKSKGMSTRCSSVLKQISLRLDSLNISSPSSLRDMQKLNECTDFVLKTLEKCCALRSSKSRPVRCCSSVISFCEDMIQRTALKRPLSSSLDELYMVDVSVRMLYDLLAKKSTEMDSVDLRKRVESLKNSRVKLQKGISPLGKKIDELYTVLIRTRIALLDSQTYSI